MATFLEDLQRALAYTALISRERARGWNTEAGLLLQWQEDSFSAVVDGREASDINAAWQRLRDEKATRRTAELLHAELEAIVAFQAPLVDRSYDPNPYEAQDIHEPEPPRRIRPLKKAVSLVKTLLESLKEILGDLLGVKGKAILQIAIEAAEAFS